MNEFTLNFPLFIKMEDEDIQIKTITKTVIIKYNTKRFDMPRYIRYYKIYITKKAYDFLGKISVDEIVLPLLKGKNEDFYII